MEVFLHLWDELDDLAGACRHIATSFAIEATARAQPAATVLLTVVAVPLGWLSSLKNLI